MSTNVIAHAMDIDMDTIFKTLDSCQEINIHDISEKPLDTNSSKILVYYKKLNDIGKHEATKRIEELTHIEKYTTMGHLLLDTAHETQT